MKKINRRSFLAAAGLTAAALALTACGGSASSTASSTASSAASSEAASTSAAAELTTVEAGKLTMATNATFPPYEMTTDNGTIEGIDVETAQAIADKLGELGGNYDNSTVFLCHGDCIEDAKYVENILKSKYGVKEVLINYTGAVIGSHSGPGTMALFFLGSER